MTDEHLRRSFDALQEDRETTIIYFSSRPRDLAFDKYLFLGHDEQRMFGSFDDLCRVTGGEPCATDPTIDGDLAPAT